METGSRAYQAEFQEGGVEVGVPAFLELVLKEINVGDEIGYAVLVDHRDVSPCQEVLGKAQSIIAFPQSGTHSP